MNPSTVMQWLPVVLLLTLAVAVALTFVILMVKNYRQVLTGLGKACVAIAVALTAIGKAIHANYRGFAQFARTTLLTRGAFFRYAILVCMMMSVVHGSHLFTTKNNISALDLALAATFDIGTWVLMEAMISTRKRGYLGASIGILVSIVIVSSISFLANIAFNAHYYDPSQFDGFDLSQFGINTQSLIVVAQSSPPLIIILMTLVAETFIKADIKEEVTYAQRIWSRHQRKIDREAAKLRLASERANLQQQYKNIAPVKKVPAWSFLGFTVYQKQQPSNTEEIQKIVDDLVPVLTQKVVEGFKQSFPQPLPNLAPTVQKVIVEEIKTSGQTLPQTSQKVLPEKTQTLEKETDPTLQKVPQNLAKTSGPTSAKLSENLKQPSGQTLTKVPENLSQSSGPTFTQPSQNLGQSSPKTSEPTTGDLSPQVNKVLSSKVTKDLRKVTRKLSPELLKSFEEENTKIDTTKRNAITKVEAAQYLKCSAEDLEAAIKKGQIKMYGNSKDKVLVSTLKNYTPLKKRRTKVIA